MSIIEFYVSVENVDQVAAIFDRIDIYRSPDGDGSPTPYTPITATDPTSAVLNGTVEGPWNLNGQSFFIIVDGADPVNVSFSGSNPFNLRTVLDTINDAFPNYAGLASEVAPDTDKIKLSSKITGTPSILQVSGTAAATLGLSTSRTNGKAARPILSSSTEEYLFRDYDGESSLWYKTRYVNSTTGATSDFSDPFQAGEGEGLPDSAAVVGKIALADPTGAPIVGRRIIFVTTAAPQVIAHAGFNYGVLPSVDRIEIYTDRDGRSTVSLVKGQRMKVFIEGTSFQREFVVPTADFDILTVASVQPDPLDIVTAPPMPIRVT